MAEKIAIVDYGAGNLRSVANALGVAAGARAVAIRTTSDPADILTADRIVLPGVGPFGQCAAALGAFTGLEEALDEAVKARVVPFPGHGVGMQLMDARLEERRVGTGCVSTCRSRG